MAIFTHYPAEIALSVIAGAALFFTSDAWERIMFRRWMRWLMKPRGKVLR